VASSGIRTSPEAAIDREGDERSAGHPALFIAAHPHLPAGDASSAAEAQTCFQKDRSR
jgi:hypothetical protein